MLNKVKEIKDEYEIALSILESSNYTVIEESNKLSIRVNAPDFDLLNKINDSLKNFVVHPNVDKTSYILADLLEDLSLNLITIDKVNHILLVLDKKKFIEKITQIDYLMFTPAFINTLQKVSKPLNNKLNILHFLSSESFSTHLINFFPTSQDVETLAPIKIDIQKANEVSAFLSHNKHINQDIFFNPFAFRIVNPLNIQDEVISKEIKKYFYHCFIEALSDSFNLESNKYVLNAKKKISILKDENFSTQNYLTFCTIFDFLVTEHKYTEKYIIIKKVLTIYTHHECTITEIDKNLGNIWKTTHNYYDDYIEDNIKDFFDTKDQLLKEATSISKLVYEQTDKVNTSIVASILSILVVFATTLFRQISTISLITLVFILLIFIVFSVTYYAVIRKSSLNRYELTKDQFEYFVSDVSFLDETELKKIKKYYLEDPFNQLEITLVAFRNILIGINMIAGVITILLY
jgi:hypothetical protein